MGSKILTGRLAPAGALAAALAIFTQNATAQDAAPASPVVCDMPATEIYRKVAPSVVQVLAYGIDPFAVAERVHAGSGSGASIGDDFIVTNFHVVAGASEIGVTGNGVILGAALVGSDPVLDVAVLRVPGIGSFAPPMEVAPPDALEMGQKVYVIGYPLGIGKSITAGIISGLGRVIPLNTSSWLSPYIQTDAAVSGGNSGGPLVDGCGRGIGMVSLRSLNPAAENMGYAIPVSTMNALVPELIQTGKVARPWHGLYGRMMTPLIRDMMGEPDGLGFLVETVEPGSAADKAGVKGGNLPVLWGMQEMVIGGDIIVAVNGASVLTREQAIAAVRTLEIGGSVDLTILRGGVEIETSAMIEERPVLERDLAPYRRQQDGGRR